MSSTQEPGRIIPVEPEFVRKNGEISEAEDLLLYGNCYTTRSGARLDPRFVETVFSTTGGEPVQVGIRYRPADAPPYVAWLDFDNSTFRHRQAQHVIMALTSAEKQVLHLSADLWNAFVKLPKEHPSDVPEFQAALHELQALIALRVARRVNPEVWR